MPISNSIIDALMDGGFRNVRFRGKARLAKLLPLCGRRTATVFGARMILDLADHIERHVYLGSYEPLNVHRFMRTLRPGDTVFDVGANIGFFTALAARRVGASGRVLAFEPHPLNFAALSEMVTRNGLRCVIPLAVGLDETNGK